MSTSAAKPARAVKPIDRRELQRATISAPLQVRSVKTGQRWFAYPVPYSLRSEHMHSYMVCTGKDGACWNLNFDDLCTDYRTELFEPE